MENTRLSSLTQDSEFGKKLAFAALSLLLIVTSPLAMGLISSDLEEQTKGLKKGDPPEGLPSIDRPAQLLGEGIGPTLLLIASILIFSVPTGVFLFSFVNVSVYFRAAEDAIRMSFFSLIPIILIGLAALALQMLAGLMLPVALAEYARGKDLRPALSPVNNALRVVEYGAQYWLKAAGVPIALLGLVLLSMIQLPFKLNIIIPFFLAAWAVLSLILGGRYAVSQLEG